MLRKTRPGSCDSDGRCKPEEIPESDFPVQADLIVFALGQSGSGMLRNVFPDLQVSKNGLIAADSAGKTNLSGVYAGGDCVNGGSTVVQAVADGKKAAEAIWSAIESGGAK